MGTTFVEREISVCGVVMGDERERCVGCEGKLRDMGGGLWLIRVEYGVLCDACGNRYFPELQESVWMKRWAQVRLERAIESAGRAWLKPPQAGK